MSKKDKLSEQDKKDWKDFLDNPLSFFEKENLEKEHSKRPKKFKGLSNQRNEQKF